MENEEIIITIEFILLGDEKVGKTQIINIFMKEEFKN